MMTTATARKAGGRCGNCLAKRLATTLIQSLALVYFACHQMRHFLLTCMKRRGFWPCAATHRLAAANGYTFWHVLAFTNNNLASVITQTLNLLCLDGVCYCGGSVFRHYTVRQWQITLRRRMPIVEYWPGRVWHRLLYDHVHAAADHAHPLAIQEINQN